MNITRFASAPAYFPPEHHDMRCLRLQGKEAGPSDALWIGMSQILPGGKTSLAASASEKMYFVLEGELTVVYQEPGTDPVEVILRRYDSCRLAPGEGRQLLNRTNTPVLVLLAMPNG